jgi:hypothetical protein
MNKKITTIDDLAVMIEKESRANEKRFSSLEGRFDILEKKFGTSEEKMAAMMTKQDLYRFEKRILAAIGGHSVELKDHDRRILLLEKIVKP